MEELLTIIVIVLLFCFVAWVIDGLLSHPFIPDDLSFEDDEDDCEETPACEACLSDQLEDLAEDLQKEILQEWQYARSKFGPFHSSHEGFAVLHEEFDELKDEVWSNETKNPERNQRMREEAIQVAAMALRFLTDVCHKEQV